MCGIAGILDLRGAQPPESLPARLDRMVSRMEHRGPDDRGVYATADGALALGHVRLSIIDLTSAAHQPMIDPETGNAIVFNGEIYNFRHLRAQLERESGGEWRSHSDTEVVLRAYRCWGERFLDRLRGMFAFAIWDASQRRLLLVRDRLGIKPLYYAESDGLFAFASEVRAVQISGVPGTALDPAGILDYLQFQALPAERTMLKDVTPLRPGTFMIVSAHGAQRTATWWRAADHAVGRSEVPKPDVVREVLADAVDAHFESDVPVAVFLSGGIDSSAIVGLAARAGHTPSTFSVVFDDAALDERQYSRAVARRFGCAHEEIAVDSAEMLDQVPRAVESMDLPTGDGVNTYLISRAVRNAGIKVALSGLGSDELFGGYSSFRRFALLRRLLKANRIVPDVVRGAAASLLHRASWSRFHPAMMKLVTAVEGEDSMADIYPTLRLLFDRRTACRLLRTEIRPALPRAAAPSQIGSESISHFSVAELSGYMHDVLLRDADQMGMAHNLEIRVPFLDHHVVEYVLGIIDRAKFNGGSTPKQLLVLSLGPILSDDLVHRKKRGFVLPFAAWMRGPLRSYCESMLFPEPHRDSGVLDRLTVERLWRRFVDGDAGVTWSRAWSVVVLQAWLQNRATAMAA